MSKGNDFENILKELETVVSQLDGEVKLEEALELFEKGIKLSSECEKFLTRAEQRIELLKRQSDGSAKLEAFAEVSVVESV